MASQVHFYEVRPGNYIHIDGFWYEVRETVTTFSKSHAREVGLTLANKTVFKRPAENMIPIAGVAYDAPRV